MKDTGIKRKIDDLGRIVIPAELREHFDIKEGDKLEISTDGSRIILQKVGTPCVFCNATDNVTFFAEKLICADCIAKIKAEL